MTEERFAELTVALWRAYQGVQRLRKLFKPKAFKGGLDFNTERQCNKFKAAVRRLRRAQARFDSATWIAPRTHCSLRPRKLAA